MKGTFTAILLAAVLGVHVTRADESTRHRLDSPPASTAGAAGPTIGISGRSPILEARSGAVRAADSLARFLLEEGRERSATFATLVAGLEATDVVVLVEVEPKAARSPSGRLDFVAALGERRHLRVQIEPGTTSYGQILSRQQELMAILGHELQHALEVAAASPRINNASGFARHYRTVGISLGGDAFDTAAARLAGKLVLTELMNGGPRGDWDGP